jgi:predicted phage terminase large subunit-like protein
MFRGYQTSEHINGLLLALEKAVTEKGSRLIVTMPPRHSKSLNVSEHLPAWYLGNNPDKRIITASHTAQLAYTFSRRVRNKMLHPSWPFERVRVADDKGAVQAWDIADSQGGYVAVGVGGTPTGHGADLLVLDDPIRSQADAESETVRDALWEWYQGTMRTRLEPDASIILTATRWHTDDLTGRLLEEEKHGGEQWDHLHMPAINDRGEALWPERWPVDALLKIKSAVGSKVFEAQYQGRPVPTEGGTFKAQWWRTYDLLPPMERVEVYVDSAFKTGTANDYSVFAAWGVDHLNNAYLLNVWRDRVQFTDLIRLGYASIAWCERQYPLISPLLVVEDQASGQSAIQTWRSGELGPSISVTPFKAGTESKLARAESVTPLVEGGRVFLPKAAPWLDDWLTEHQSFPSGKHDDQVDTTSMALRRLLNTSGGWSREEHAGFADWLSEMGVGGAV